MVWPALAALLAAVSTAGEPRIVFASDRAAALIRPAVYTVAANGEARRVSPYVRRIREAVAAPRGGRVALVVDGDLYVTSRGGAALSRLTTRDDVTRPSFSPTGDRIAYVSRRRRVAVLVRLADATPRVLASNLGREVTGGVAWSPDGTRVVLPDARDGDHQTLAIHDLRNGRVTRLRDSPSYDYDPAWSPDGRAIAFTFNSGLADRDSVLLYDVATRRVDQLAQYGHGPTWSPNAQSVAYTYSDELWVAARSGGAARKLVQFDNLGSESPLSAVFAPWSPDSSEVASVVGGTLRAIRVDGTGMRRIKVGRSRSRIVAYPDWTRSGALVVPGERYDPGDRDIYSIRPDGGDLRVLTANGQDETDPVLSPDGRRLAFSRCRIPYAYEPKDCDVVVAAADGAGARVVARGAAEPAWSPDSKWVAVARARTIEAVSTAGVRVRVLAHARVLDGLDWSPDGRRLAYVHGRPYVVAVGGKPRPLPEPAECSEDPAWAPNGSSLAFSSGECEDELYPQFHRVYLAATAGSRPEQVPVEADAEGDGSPAWSPDGASLAFVRTDYDADERLRSHLVAVRLGDDDVRPIYVGPGSVFGPDWGRASVAPG